MKNVDVRLEAYELWVAAQVGAMRRIRSVCDGCNKNKHAEKSDWATDIDGAAAEMAVAKYLGVYWDGRVTRKGGDYKALDIRGFQIRSTVVKSGHLIVRENDADGQNYILVICDAPVFKLIGSYSSTDAKSDEFKYEDCWFVPQSQLLDLPEAA